jgi:hypothetical protein
VVAFLDAAAKVRRPAIEDIRDELVLVSSKRVLVLIVSDVFPEDVGQLDGPAGRGNDTAT